MTYIVCKKCGEKFYDPDVRINNIIPAERDREGKDRLDIVLTCPECEAEYCCFVPIADLMPCDAVY